MGKRALSSGTGTGPGPEAVVDMAAMEATVAACEPDAVAANWTVGTETNSSLNVFAMASSSSVAGRDDTLDVTRRDASGSVLPDEV